MWKLPALNSFVTPIPQSSNQQSQMYQSSELKSWMLMAALPQRKNRQRRTAVSAMPAALPASMPNSTSLKIMSVHSLAVANFGPC